MKEATSEPGSVPVCFQYRRVKERTRLPQKPFSDVKPKKQQPNLARPLCTSLLTTLRHPRPTVGIGGHEDRNKPQEKQAEMATGQGQQWFPGAPNTRNLEKELMHQILEELRAKLGCNYDTLYKQARWDTKLILWNSKCKQSTMIRQSDSLNSTPTKGGLV